jgi:hypothetical protein
MPSSGMLCHVALHSMLRLLVTDVDPSAPIHVTLMMEAICSSEMWFSQEPHGITSQKTAFVKENYFLQKLHRTQQFHLQELQEK